MHDRGIIWAGLALFLALFTLPAWHNLLGRVSARGPDPVLPTAQKQCVAPLGFMKTSHMRLLLDWREAVVRRGESEYAASGGRHYTMSVTNTCLRQCHTARADFCDRCHNYEAVRVPCWDCHLDDKTMHGSAR